MKEYIRKVMYHETDKMGIVHHSNYIKWMEEARIDFLEQIGFGYAKLEDDGIISPVVSVECKYKNPTRFGDTVSVKVEIEQYKGVKLVVHYEITNADTGEAVLEGVTKHCFVDANGKPIMIKKQFEAFDKKLKELSKN